jgi:hypothetical protein
MVWLLPARGIKGEEDQGRHLLTIKAKVSFCSGDGDPYHPTIKSVLVEREKKNGFRRNRGCQMVCFQTKNPNLGTFWRALKWKLPVYFTVIWNILQSFGMFYGYLVMLW